ncbi:hypothetical protein TWF569_003462 [Orbilia oligospora]|uniref:Rhodopsin domain-containing protein n=1 Tax=Orbilia oligospora TaxID=2813651 RepID=A0A7C8JDI2_ORBOL|nr:hypothetical protein TWF706_007901 [Orbilia oligospora]KAF3105943.1 hypothetical protein TWF102_001845 [Orbilia oligospora]KAF3112609.1 hypothetical protein TWF103_002851 [Orbilia oligospora]KAF3136843.1 hypothetical protein TWF594_007732 [Orbilia oligospora]KAF3141750.1 hypothetical protein TWF703_001772 [Orbilia oligospora]
MDTSMMTPEEIAAMQAAQKAAVEAFYKEAWTLLAIALLFIIGRLYARFTLSGGFHAFKADDYLMVFAGVVYSMETTAAYCVGFLARGLANNGMTPEQRQALEPGSEEWNLRITGVKIQLIGWSLYTLLLWLLKGCLLIFYSRLTDGLGQQTIKIRVGAVMLITTYIAVILSIHLGCHPYHQNFQINPEPPNACQPAISKIDCYVTVVLNVLTDMYLMYIPLPLLWKAQIPLKRKFLLIAMFSGGCFIITAGILRVGFILADPIGGALAAGSWACRETFVSVIIGNIPMIYPLFMRGVSSVRSMYATGTARTYGSNKSNGTAMELPRYNNSSKNKKGQYSVGRTILNATESEERIMASKGSEGIKADVTYEVKSAPASINEDNGSGRSENYGRSAGYTVSIAAAPTGHTAHHQHSNSRH